MVNIFDTIFHCLKHTVLHPGLHLIKGIKKFHLNLTKVLYQIHFIIKRSGPLENTWDRGEIPRTVLPTLATLYTLRFKRERAVEAKQLKY